MRVAFLSVAATELTDAVALYNEQSEGLGYQFAVEVQRTIDRIAKFPEAWPVLSERTRRYRMRRFPYGGGDVLRRIIFLITFLLSIVLAGCGAVPSEIPQSWKLHDLNTSRTWQANFIEIKESTLMSFQMEIFFGTNVRHPNYTRLTTSVKCTRLTLKEAKKVIGKLWILIPAHHFYYYLLSSNNIAWWYSPASRDGTAPNGDYNTLISDVLYGSVSGPVILLAQRPIQLTTIQSNPQNQTLELKWQPYTPHFTGRLAPLTPN